MSERTVSLYSNNKVFYISDLHFGHANILRYDNRPFPTVEENTEEIVKRWNSVVKSEDTVYVLGDVSWYSYDKTKQIFDRLNGHKILIRGNHDKNTFDGIFEKCYDYYELYYNSKVKVVLSHYPIVAYNGAYRGVYHLYGHVHVTEDNNMINRYIKDWEAYYLKPLRMANVGCMMPWMDYTPRTLDEIVKYFKW